MSGPNQSAKFVYIDPSTGERRPVVFAEFHVTAHDKEGNEIDMRCKCGKPGNMLQGKECFLIRCNECGWT